VDWQQQYWEKHLQEFVIKNFSIEKHMKTSRILQNILKI
jgi:hypothetical protein